MGRIGDELPITPTSSLKDVEASKDESKAADGRTYSKVNKTLANEKKTLAEKIQKLAKLEQSFSPDNKHSVIMNGADILVKQLDPDKNIFALFFVGSETLEIDRMEVEIREGKMFIPLTQREVTLEDFESKNIHASAENYRKQHLHLASKNTAIQIEQFFDQFAKTMDKGIRPLYGSVFTYDTATPSENLHEVFERDLPEKYRKVSNDLRDQIRSYLKDAKQVELLLGPKDKRTQANYDQLKMMLFESYSSQITRHPLFEKISGIIFNEEKNKYKKVGAGSAFYENLMYAVVVRAVNDAVETLEDSDRKPDEYWSLITMQARVPHHKEIAKQKKGPLTSRLEAMA